MKRISLFSLLAVLSCLPAMILAQKAPASHANISRKGPDYFLEVDGKKLPELDRPAPISLTQIMGSPKGQATGLMFDFAMPELNGKMYFGLIPYGDSDHPQPVFFRQTVDILGGRSFLNISQQLKGRFDMVGWEANEVGVIGYRIADNTGHILYEGRVRFTGKGPFEVACTLTEGPFVNLLQPDGATISFETNQKTQARVVVGEKVFEEEKASLHHEIAITGLTPNTLYPYTVQYDGFEEHYRLKTAPEKGSRTAFTFAYASDSRSGQGGGERDVYGANFYIMKKIMALATYKGVSFMQFSGDLIDGYCMHPEDIEVQYANWKRAVEPFTHYFPLYISMGNHEALSRIFVDAEAGRSYQVDRFPYATESAEAVFARNFVNPRNGPTSEDGAVYDPKEKTTDFPSYEENVFYYIHDNVAVMVLNSDYWYSPSTGAIPYTDGGLHGYIMDQQLAWLESTLKQLEADEAIDHIFVTQHTPTFPNGGHVGDDMWYRGNNNFRPYVNGKPLEKGIIQRRDQILDLLVNKSQKVIGILTGDEHNYCRTAIGPETEIYPEDYEYPKLTLSRTIYQINNGAAGAPYYAQEQTPWTPFTSSFTTQNALVFFHVEGKKIQLEVRNPDTLEEVDRMEMR